MHRFAPLFLALSLAGCPAPATEPMFDTGVDAASTTTDGGSSDTGSSDTGSSDVGSGSDAIIDAAPDLDAAADDAATADTGTAGTGDHLLFSEVSVAPAGGEFFEIWNPTSAAISLDEYYVSDNGAYHGIAAGSPWNPMATPGTDFLVGFPAGTIIAPDAVLVLATDPMFEATFSRCPDFVLSNVPTICADGRTAAAMRVPTNGGLDPTLHGALLSNDREMLVLFRWNGTASIVTDVDYVTWGMLFDAGVTRADKTGVVGYAPDTASASQHPAVAPTAGQSAVRCAGEVGETTTGGNGVGGHDETSEHLDAAFGVVVTPTPGIHGGCS